MNLQWYHYAGGAALAYWLWQRDQAQRAQLAVLATQAASAGTGPTAEDVAAEHRAAVAAREQIAKLDAALAAQTAITTQTVGAISGTVRQILPPMVNAPPRVVANTPSAIENEKTLSMTPNMGADLRIVPKEGSQSIATDVTFGQTPTAATYQRAQELPWKKSVYSVPEDLAAARKLRST